MAKKKISASNGEHSERRSLVREGKKKIEKTRELRGGPSKVRLSEKSADKEDLFRGGSTSSDESRANLGFPRRNLEVVKLLLDCNKGCW